MSNVLIVDNDDRKRTAVRLAAKEAGFADTDLVTAASREEAEGLLDQPFGVAVVDLALRGEYDEEGVDLVRFLHARQPECNIIALTEHRENDAGLRAMRAGATFFVNARWADLNWQVLLVHKLRLARDL